MKFIKIKESNLFIWQNQIYACNFTSGEWGKFLVSVLPTSYWNLHTFIHMQWLLKIEAMYLHL